MRDRKKPPTVTDPKLLTAVCQFAYDLFENENICSSREKMKPFCAEINSLVELIPYLGGYKYPLLLQKSR